MTRKKTDALAAVQASDQVKILLEPIVCQSCEAVCWSVEGKASGTMGNSGWETTLIYTSHQVLSTALLSAARVLSTLGGRSRRAEESAWLIEHHPRLW